MNRAIRNKNFIMLMIGAPGVGKGTYSKMLSKDLNIEVLSSGEELRNIVKNNENVKDESIQEIKNILNQGKFLDDEYMLKFISLKLNESKYSKGVILDGFPRNINQAKLLEKHYKSINLVLKIELDENILIRKLLGRRVCHNCGKGYNVCGIDEGEYLMEPILPKKKENCCDDCGGNLVSRQDDTEVIIKDRLNVYNEQTEPLENYYVEQGLVEVFKPTKGLNDYPKLLAAVSKRINLLNMKYKY